MKWKTSQREFLFDRPLVMGILNATPDSFSDGGNFYTLDNALRHAEKMIDDGVDIIDIGGESTRPGSERVSAEAEIERTAPAIAAIKARFDIPVSIDTSKASVAAAAIDAGAEIINDISGLRFDAQIAELAAQTDAGLILMHSLGEFETMHSQEPVKDIIADVTDGLRASIDAARAAGVSRENIVLDVGIGFGKTPGQNLELLAKLDKLISELSAFPMLVGTSRKSFIGKLLSDALPDKRLAGSLASISVAVWNGAHILRVHDVKESVDAVKVVCAIKEQL